MSRNELNDVREFHKKFSMVVGDKPGHLSERYISERIGLIEEEFNEFMTAVSTNDIAEQIDALIDMIYVIKGTLVALGISDTAWKILWDDVHRANMSKVRGVGPRGNKVDVVKPDDWVEPQTKKILRAAGYEWLKWFTVAGEFLSYLGRDNDEDRSVL